MRINEPFTFQRLTHTVNDQEKNVSPCKEISTELHVCEKISTAIFQRQATGTYNCLKCMYICMCILED